MTNYKITNVLSNNVGIDEYLSNAIKIASDSYIRHASSDDHLSPISHTMTTQYIDGYWYVVVSVMMQKKEAML